MLFFPAAAAAAVWVLQSSYPQVALLGFNIQTGFFFLRAPLKVSGKMATNLIGSLI